MQRGSFQNLQDLLSPANQGLGLPSDSSDQESEGPDSTKRILLIQNQLPLKCWLKEDGHWDFEWDKDSLFYQSKAALVESNQQVMYVGQLGADIPSDQQDRVSAELMSRFTCAPVFLPTAVKDRFYKGMCKQIMWPLFHYILPMSPQSQARYDPNLWQAYIAANKKFADRVVEVINPEKDFIWAHDYHLLLLPTLLRKRFHTVRIGFFLHSPFPSSEMFRAFPMRAELLRGMLNADLVGFHTFDYARHFLSCCSRIMGLEFVSKRGSIELEYFGRRVRIRISPVGVEVSRVQEVMTSPDYEWRLGELKTQFSGRTLLIGVDDLDPFKGIDLKLQAMESLLVTHPELVGQVVLLQVANPARIMNKEVVEMHDQVLAEVKRINEKFQVGEDGCDYKPIELWYRQVPLHERVALYSLAEVAVVTATRDGMNLVPYEYVACRQESQAVGIKTSMLVVSEFVGCSPSLSGAIRVNPWSIEDTSDAFYRAITMRENEKMARHEQHYRYISTHTVCHWAGSFFSSLEGVCEELATMKTYGLGFGLSFRVVALASHFRHLEVTEVVHAYETSNRCAILLDYDGTITTERGCSLAIPPTQEVLALLKALTSDERNYVCIVSGRSRTDLDKWLGEVPKLGIIAEHGCFYRPQPDALWEQGKGPQMLAEVQQWKAVTVPILESYAAATDGSHVQNKESAVVWHFHDADPDFGSWQAKELVGHLEDLLVGEPVDVSVGQSTVEIKPKGINKGSAVERVLQYVAEDGGLADMVMCVGDDRSDEEMFVGLSARRSQFGTEDCKVFACTVGQKPSKAEYYVNDPAEVLEILKACTHISKELQS